MVQGDLVRTARVGEPIKLLTSVWDDGLPKRRRDSSNTAEELNAAWSAPISGYRRKGQWPVSLLEHIPW